MPREIYELEAVCRELAQQGNIDLNNSVSSHLNSMHRIKDFMKDQKKYQRWGLDEVSFAGCNEKFKVVYCSSKLPKNKSQVSEVLAVEDRQRMITIMPINGESSCNGDYKVYIDDIIVNKALAAIPGAGIELSGSYIMWEISEVKNFLRDILEY